MSEWNKLIGMIEMNTGSGSMELNIYSIYFVSNFTNFVNAHVNHVPGFRGQLRVSTIGGNLKGNSRGYNQFQN